LAIAIAIADPKKVDIESETCQLILSAEKIIYKFMEYALDQDGYNRYGVAIFGEKSRYIAPVTI